VAVAWQIEAGKPNQVAAWQIEAGRVNATGGKTTSAAGKMTKDVRRWSGSMEKNYSGSSEIWKKKLDQELHGVATCV
jgi:hypothetical protein